MVDELEYNTDIQLAENESIDMFEINYGDYVKKRELLSKTKIQKQTWSILEIYQKIKDEKLVLNPAYQRNEIWKNDKKSAFIESLYMQIMIPPIYVVEIPGKDLLSETKYEVVDGKQRLTAINDFVRGKLTLSEKSLEYFADIFGNKNFTEIQNVESERTTEMLSSVLDIYVITANSPEFTKYDIFARLNKGAEKLKVNEIRKAIYHSDVTNTITAFVNDILSNDNLPKKERYCKVFSQNDIKRYEDYGRFYRSVAFYLQSNLSDEKVERYNSRPRDMINAVLQDLQNHQLRMTNEEVIILLEKTIELKERMKGIQSNDYIIDACIPFVISNWKEIDEKLDEICSNQIIRQTLDRSPATTANVNQRLKCVKEIVLGD